MCITQVTNHCFLLFLAGFVITQVATSTGSDGHSLALTESGEVFSWGDGDYGKLGHGKPSLLSIKARWVDRRNCNASTIAGPQVKRGEKGRLLEGQHPFQGDSGVPLDVFRYGDLVVDLAFQQPF